MCNDQVLRANNHVTIAQLPKQFLLIYKLHDELKLHYQPCRIRIIAYNDLWLEDISTVHIFRKTFTLANIDKLVKSLQEDLDCKYPPLASPPHFF